MSAGTETQAVDPTELARSLMGEDQPDQSTALVPESNIEPNVEVAEPTLSSPGLRPVAEESMSTEETASGKKNKQQQQRNKKNLLRNLIPSTDRLLLYKINDRGQRSYIGDYGSGDLERSASIEQFVKEYVVPSYGAGDFIVELRKPNGNTEVQGAVTILDPQGGKQQQRDSGPSIMEMFELQRKTNEAADKKAKESSGNMMDMFKMLMATKGEKGDGDGGMNMMMMMMMMQNMNKPSAPAVDPMQQVLMQKILSRLEEPPPLPPIPPMLPPPVPNATESMGSVAEIVKVVSETMRAAQPQTQNNDLITTLLTKVMQPDKTGIGAKDIVEMLPTIRDMLGQGKEGASTFNDYLEGLMRLDEIRGGGQQEDHSMLAGLAEAVVGVVRDIKMQQMQMELIKSGKGRLASGDGEQRNQITRRRRAAETPVQPIEEPQEQEQVATPQRPKSKVPKIPVGFRKFAIRMIQAHKKGEEPSLVMALFEGLLHLREESEEWAPYIEEFMMLAGSGEKAAALRMLTIFMHTFVKAKLIPLPLVGLAIKSIEMNWEEIIETTGIGKAVQEMQEEEGEEVDPREAVEDFIGGEEGIELEAAGESDDDDVEVDPDDIEGFDPDSALVTEPPEEGETGPAGPGLLDEEGSEEPKEE